MLLLIIASCKLVEAQNATIEKVSIAPSGDYSSVVVHVDFSIYNCLNKDGWVYVFFYDENQKGLVSPDNQYSLELSDGTNIVSNCEKISPRWDASVYRDFTINIPASQMHVGWSLNKPLYYKVGIWTDKKWIVSSNKYRFKISYDLTYGLMGMCVPDSDNSFLNYVRDIFNRNNKVDRINYAMSWGNNSNQNQGGYSGGGNSGSGYSGGYSGGGNSSHNNYSSGSSSSSKRPSTRTCPICKGTGKGSDQIVYEPNYTGKDNSRYCSTCGRTSPAHSHRQSNCGTCHGTKTVPN